MADFSAMEREHRLLLRCCRLDTADAIISEIRSLLDADFDWDKLIERAVSHQVAPLLHRTLDRVAPDKVPSAVAYALRVHYQGWAEHTENLWCELRRVLEGLAEGGVPAIPFKGPVLGHSVYGDTALRPFGDLDFLLRPQDVDRALTLLEALDYVRPPTLSPKKERHFRRYAGQYRMPRHDAKVWIEPHWTLSQHAFAIDLDYEALWKRATVTEIDGHRVLRFALRDELLVLCIHGFREQWRRLKWICDVAEIVRVNPAMDWEVLTREARAAGCGRILELGLVLAHDLLDAPVPDHVLEHRDNRLDKLVAHVLTGLFDGNLDGPEVWRPHAFYFNARERLRDRITYLARTVLAPRSSTIEMIWLPDGLFWAYYPVRWIHDYVLLPPWLAWKRLRRA